MTCKAILFIFHMLPSGNTTSGSKGLSTLRTDRQARQRVRVTIPQAVVKAYQLIRQKGEGEKPWLLLRYRKR